MTKALRHLTLVVLLAVIFCMTSIQAAADTQKRFITVIGEGELLVDADEIILKLSVETFAADLGEAKAKNDQIIKKVLTLATDYKIEQKYIRTSQITVAPKYQDRNNPTTLLGYSVTNSISITIKDTGKFDAFLTDALKAGANSVSRVEFRSSEIDKYKEQALALAMKAAREKAVKLAGELGLKVGRPLSIQEGASVFSGLDNLISLNANYRNALVEGTIAPGQIRVYGIVTVSFELV